MKIMSCPFPPPAPTALSWLPRAERLSSVTSFHHDILTHFGPKTVELADHEMNFCNCEPSKKPLISLIFFFSCFGHIEGIRPTQILSSDWILDIKSVSMTIVLKLRMLSSLSVRVCRGYLHTHGKYTDEYVHICICHH